MLSSDPDQLAALLERFYRSFDVARHIPRDPLQFPRRYEGAEDIEVAAFIAASLAFGRVAAFGAVLEHLFTSLGPAPARTLRQADPATLAEASKLRYRWLEARDIRALLEALGAALRKHGSLQAIFKTQDTGEGDTWKGLSGLLEELKALAEEAHEAPSERGRALAFLFPSTRGAAACKRQHLFLRWMVRSDQEGADLGIWSVDPARLVMPCDVHVARIGHALGLSSRREPSRRSADQLTARLREIDPSDPVRFDFALSHLGISGGCRGRRVDTVCSPCDLRSACRWWAVPE